MIFPEGVWNMSPNLLVRKLFPGVYRIAKETKAPVVPVITMLYEDVFYVNRGEALNIHGYIQDEGISILRDTLASLKYEIMEIFGKDTRENLLCG